MPEKLALKLDQIAGSSAFCVVIMRLRFDFLLRDDATEGRCCSRFWFLGALSKAFDARVGRWSCCRVHGGEKVGHWSGGVMLLRAG